MLLSSRANAIVEGIQRQFAGQATKYQAFRGKIDNLFAYLSLNWRQWLLLFATGGLVIAIEIHNHSRMWRDHGSGQTVLTDVDLIWEIVVYGLLIPIFVGVLLGHLGRTEAERDRLARDFALRRELVNQIFEAQDWHELAELVVSTPGKLFSADRAWLLAERPSTEEFEQVDYWERPGSGLMPALAPVAPTISEQCMEAMSLKRNKHLTCYCPDSESTTNLGTRYCLCLSSKHMHKTALLFDVPVDHDLTSPQLKVLNELCAEMSLAIENANLQDREQRQVDVARNERLRIARDLHDTLGQNISYLRLKLEQLSGTRLASDRTEFQDELANMLVVADEAYEQVRDALDELRSREHRDLEELVQMYANQVGARNGFSTRVHSSGRAATLTHRQSRQTMYILREALNNVEKHAGAQNVDIHLQWRGGQFTMSVRDDGRGFQQEDPIGADGYGMIIMGERSRAINANLTIESAPGNGTEVTLCLPLTSSAPAD